MAAAEKEEEGEVGAAAAGVVGEGGKEVEEAAVRQSEGSTLEVGQACRQPAQP